VTIEEADKLPEGTKLVYNASVGAALDGLGEQPCTLVRTVRRWVMVRLEDGAVKSVAPQRLKVNWRHYLLLGFNDPYGEDEVF
jgi:hypothetical protein